MLICEGPPTENYKDYVVHLFCQYQDDLGNTQKIPIARADYKQAHNGIHFDKYFARTPQRDESITWEFGDAREKFWNNATTYAKTFVKNHGLEEVKIK
jgi:hypothetical protein